MDPDAVEGIMEKSHRNILRRNARLLRPHWGKSGSPGASCGQRQRSWKNIGANIPDGPHFTRSFGHTGWQIPEKADEVLLRMKKGKGYPMSKRKKPKMEFRYYKMPEGSPILALLGEKWLQSYGRDVDFLHFHNFLEIGYCYGGAGR